MSLRKPKKHSNQILLNLTSCFSYLHRRVWCEGLMHCFRITYHLWWGCVTTRTALITHTTADESPDTNTKLDNSKDNDHGSQSNTCLTFAVRHFFQATSSIITVVFISRAWYSSSCYISNTKTVAKQQYSGKQSGYNGKPKVCVDLEL